MSGCYSNDYLSYAQKLSGRAKTFRVAMLPCYRGFWASGVCVCVCVCTWVCGCACFPKVCFPKVCFLKVCFPKVYFPKVYFTKVYFPKVYFLNVCFLKVYCKYASILGPNFFDPKVTQPRLFRCASISRTYSGCSVGRSVGGS